MMFHSADAPPALPPPSPDDRLVAFQLSARQGVQHLRTRPVSRRLPRSTLSRAFNPHSAALGPRFSPTDF